MPRKRILLIEEQRDVAEGLASRLRHEGYVVDTAHDGLEGLKKVRTDLPDLVVADRALPKLSGLDLTTEIRGDPRTAAVPLIMLMDHDEDGDVIAGLRLGADDCLSRPFSTPLLAARIAAVLRRSREGANPGRSVLEAGPIRICPDRHAVEVDGRTVQLTLTEFRILAALVAARGRVLTRNQFIDQAMGSDAVVTDRTIDVHLASLRRKLSSARSLIQTVRGVGYRLATETIEAAGSA